MNAVPDDPYVALGLNKDATASEIRKVYLKLVVKSHPDKFQDPVEKAKKADEFHKVQQAYELLSDDNKRAQYHEQLKLAELKRELAKNTVRTTANTSTTYAYNIRHADPRPSTFSSKTREQVYSRTPPRSFEDFEVNEPMKRSARKPSGSEGVRPQAREDERRRRADDERERERERERREKENMKSSHSDRKKARDKDRKKGSEDKHRTTHAPYLEVDSEDEEYRPRAERRGDRKSPRSSSRVVDDFARMSIDAETKMNHRIESQAEYMRHAQMKGAPEPRIGISRAATLNEASFRHINPMDDYDTPRRASASHRPVPPRRTPDSKGRESGRSSKDVPPQLRPNRSEPPNLSSRKEPIRAQTFAPKSRKESAPAPGLNRAQTWQPRVDAYDTSPSSSSSEEEPGRARRPSMAPRQTTYKVGPQGVSPVTRRPPIFEEDSEVNDLRRPNIVTAAPPPPRPPLNRTGAASYEHVHAPPIRSHSHTQSSYAPRAASPENYKSYGIPTYSRLPGEPTGRGGPLYGEIPVNVAPAYNLADVNMEKAYRRAAPSDSRYDEPRPSRRRGTAY